MRASSAKYNFMKMAWQTRRMWHVAYYLAFWAIEHLAWHGMDCICLDKMCTMSRFVARFMKFIGVANGNEFVPPKYFEQTFAASNGFFRFYIPIHKSIIVIIVRLCEHQRPKFYISVYYIQILFLSRTANYTKRSSLRCAWLQQLSTWISQ